MNSLFSKHVLATISCLALLSFPLAAISQNATKVISPPQGVANYALVQAIINKVKVKNPALKKSIEESSNWRIKKGNHTIDGDFENDENIIYEGNLTISGNYFSVDDAKLIVLGQLNANNILADSSLHVQGNVVAEGMVYASENNNFKVDGQLEAKAFINYKSNVSIKDLKVEIKIDNHQGDYDALYRSLNPDLFVFDEEFENTQFPINEDQIEINIPPALSEVKFILADYEAELFRSEPAAESLVSDYKKALSQATTVAQITQMSGLKNLDTLVAAALASRDDLSLEAQNNLFNTQVDTVLIRLALNKITPADMLVKIAQSSLSLANYTTEHKNFPTAYLATLVNSKKETDRYAATLSYQLSPAQIEQLANDPNDEVRQSLLEVYSGQVMSPNVIQNNLTHVNTEVKLALIRNNINFTVADYETLLEDEATDDDEGLVIQEAALRNLLTPSQLLGFKKTTPKERLYLLGNFADTTKVAYLKILALSGLPRKDQITIAKDLNPEDLELLNQELAASTNNQELLEQLSQEKKNPVKAELASNPALPIKIQTQLVAEIPNLQKLAKSTNPEKEWATQFEILDNLVTNPNVDKKVRASIIEFCASIENSPEFCLNTPSIFGLSEMEIEQLINAKNTLLKAEMSANLKYQNYANEASVKQLILDMPLFQKEWPTVKNQQAASFWKALSQAKSTELRKIAAVNHQTSVEDLTRLRKDKNLRVAYQVLLNPQYPKNELLKEDFYIEEQVLNINYSPAFLLEKLLTNTTTVPVDIKEAIRQQLIITIAGPNKNSLLKNGVK